MIIHGILVGGLCLNCDLYEPAKRSENCPLNEQLNDTCSVATMTLEISMCQFFRCAQAEDSPREVFPSFALELATSQ